MTMNVVDSSGWLEYFADAPNASYFAKPIQNVKKLVVPVVSIYEVFKCILKQCDTNQALQAVALMEQGTVVKLDSTIALSAALESHALKLPMADSMILATAKTYDAVIWTQDVDFKGLPNVNYVAKKS